MERRGGTPVAPAAYSRQSARMPFVNVYTSATLSDSQSAPLLKTLSSELAKALHKPESYVMTCLTPKTLMTFGGTDEPACYAEIKNIGTFTPEATAALSARLCEIFSERLGAAPKRIYIELSDAKAHLWGSDGETFA